MERTDTYADVDLSTLLSSVPDVKYARFYLTKGGEMVSLDATHDITISGISGGKTRTTHPEQGVYLYQESGLPTSGTLRVTLPAGKFNGYKLVCVLSNSVADAVSGDEVTDEPNWDLQYTYTFAYPMLVHDKYIKWSLTNSRFDVTEDVLSDLGVTVSELNSAYYIKWYILKADGSTKQEFRTSAYGTDWHFYFQDGNNGSPYVTDNNLYSVLSIYSGKVDLTGNWTSGSQVANAYIGAPGTDTFEPYKDYTVICEVATESPTIEGGAITSEPAIAVRYVFHFNATGKKPDTFVAKLKATGIVDTRSQQIATDATSVTLDLAEALAEVPSGAKYVRFYLVHGGEVVDPAGKLTVAGGTAGPEAEHGFYISKPSGLVASDLSGVKLELSAGDYEDYQVICVFSADDATSLLPTKEPDWDLQYTYAFEYPFKGDVSSAVKREETFQLSASIAETDPREIALVFDYTNKKIKVLKASDSSELTSADFSAADESFWASSTVPANFYVRWFLKNRATGVEEYIPNAIRNVNGASTLKATAKERYGRFWSKLIGDGLTDLNTIMRVKLDGTPDAPGTLFCLYDYDLVCTISTAGGETLDGSSKVTLEPATMQMQYTFHFNRPEFEGTLIAEPYKHSKEVLIPTASTTEVDVPLSDSFAKILNEGGVVTPTGLDDAFHLRWYVEKKNGLGEFEKIDNPEELVDPMVSTMYHKKVAGYGVFWNTLTAFNASNEDVHNIIPNDFATKASTEVKNLLNIHFTKPAADNWTDYRLVAVMTKDLTGSIVYPTTGVRTLEKEPTDLDIVYYFKFFVEDEFQFVHNRGASDRPYVTPETDTRLNAEVKQYNWVNETSTKEEVTGDIRQGVHSVEYNIYVDPSSTTPVRLKLPFKDYFTNGDCLLEPAAYIRWYNWVTDMACDRLAAVGTWIENTDVKTKERGLFALNNSLNGNKPSHEHVGVTFNPSGLTDSVIIACDVSKYYDGIYPGSHDDTRDGFSGLKKPYLMHEPTLSTRYIFIIRPAAKIAKKIKDTAANFDPAANKYALYEDNGVVGVSVNTANSSFSVHAESPQLVDYYVYDTSNHLVNCTNVRWEAYYHDGDGNVWKRQLAVSAGTERITSLKVNDITGLYQKTSGGDPKNIDAAAGMRFHLVGLLGDGTTMVPVIHYEFEFVEAPAYEIGSLPLNRTPEYLETNMTLQATLNFDERLELSSSISSQLENHANVPFEWSEAEYGFCYPQIDEYRIWTLGSDNSGMSSIHGDYMLLRSMNATGISESDVTHAYKYHWYISSPTLYDYTYLYSGTGNYGTFLYVDASDEARTIAKLKFQASLCAGSELCFTAAIANMTNGTTNPQVMATVYAVNAGGQKTRVVSFQSSDISTTVAGTFEDATWYQFYGKVSIPQGVSLTGVDHYEVNIENCALNTDGADYCIDEIKFYTSTGKLKVEQTGGLCYGDNLRLTAYITAEQLDHAMTLTDTPQTLYYRIFKQTGVQTTSSGKKKILYEAYPDASIYNNGGNDYGQVTVCKPVLKTNGTLDDSTPEIIAQNRGFEFRNGVLCFKIADDQIFNLDTGNDYFFALTRDLPFVGVPTTSKDDWADPNDACHIFSNFFVPKKLTIDFNDGSADVGNVIGSGCGGGTPSVTDYRIVLKYPDEDEGTGFRTYTNDNADDSKNIHFDFYIGKDDTPGFLGIFTAMRYFRQDYPSVTSWPTFTESEANYAHYGAILTTEVKAKIILARSSTFSYSPLAAGTNYFMAMPVETKTPDAKNDDICSPILFSFVVANAGPELVLGFDDVNYPDGYERVVRVGLEQLDNLRNNNFVLHIPVQSFLDKNGNQSNRLVFVGTQLTLKSTTDDNAVISSSAAVAVLKVTDGGTRPAVDRDHMYLALDFSTSAINFREGFEYELNTQYYDVNDDDGAGNPSTGSCAPELDFVIKVVPKYVTWNDGSVTPNANVNTDWNNDTNWSRSSKEELYSTTYVNNTGTTPATYVPMKFTYVTVPFGTQSANLIHLTRGSDGIYNNIGSNATANIQYDMLVRYTEQTCQTPGIHHVLPTDAVYDCEKFYGNTCKEIYFKPRAELLNQQYLTYERAWVDVELSANEWQLLSAPLKETYAGDMYVPYSNGRQQTEAFQPITFNTTVYSRTKYPVYQRSWDITGSQVFTEVTDVRNTSYAADIPYNSFSGSVATTLLQWSHTYNDVNVPYSALQGFSIRMHRKAQAQPALLRLPKDDPGYTYYKYDGNPSVTPVVSSFTKTTAGIGRFITDGTVDGTVTRDVAALHAADNKYYLVGNPYLCSIDMATFLAAHGLTKYWIYRDGAPQAEATDGLVGPMQAFFIQADTKPTITFTKAMMADGVLAANAVPARPFNGLMLTATGAATTVARVAIDADASGGFADGEDVEILYDADLVDAPVVYTVAGSQAVAINRCPMFTVLPFGVTSANPQMVDVQLTGLDVLGRTCFVYDAKEKTTIEVAEGQSFSVQSNDYGRYYLTCGDATAVHAAVTDALMISVHGHEITVSSAQPLCNVRALALDGTAVYAATDCGQQVQFHLPPGVYVVEATGIAGRQSMKVMVK